jgi:hypothetical protein
MHVNALIDAIDLAVAGKTDVFDAIYTAAHVHMRETATALAGGSKERPISSALASHRWVDD